MVYIVNDNPICTAKVGKSKDIFVDILDLHVAEGSLIVDVTAGLLKFWTKIDLERYDCIFSDRDSTRVKGFKEASMTCLQADCKNLPYRSRSIDVVVIDPPFGQLSTAPQSQDKHHLSDAYNLGEKRGAEGVYEMYQQGTEEAYRVLKNNGIFIVKCQDFVNSKKQHWLEGYVWTHAESVGFERLDKFVLVRQETPVMRHKYQYHARKNHSYFWLFRKTKSKRKRKEKTGRVLADSSV
jgi:ubiquinone/menaquinone biosynthesis C-methylase UbiE